MDPKDQAKALADLDAELARRGVAPPRDDVSAIDAELARRGPVRELSPMQRRMGLGHQGSTGILDLNKARIAAMYEFGGGVTDLTGSPALGTVANMAGDIATDPLTYIGAGVGKVAKPVLESAAVKTMWSALKPSKFARTSGDAEKAVQTLLDKGINVSEGGIEKMTAAIDVLDSKLDAAIKGAKGNVSTLSAVLPMKDVLEKYRYGGDTVENWNLIRGEVAKFLDHPEIRQALSIPVATAQEMKRGYYRELGNKGYGMGLKPDAERDAKKAIARGLAGGIERVVPEAGAINAEMGPLLNARELVSDRVGAAMNRNPLGLGAIVDPKHWPVWLMDRNEATKSMIARGMHAAAPYAPAAGATGGAVAGEVLRPITLEDYFNRSQ